MKFSDVLFDAFTYKQDPLDLTAVDYDVRARFGILTGVGTCPSDDDIEYLCQTLHKQWQSVRSPGQAESVTCYVERGAGLEPQVLAPGRALPSPCVLLLDTGFLQANGGPLYLRMRVRLKTPQKYGNTSRKNGCTNATRAVDQFVFSDGSGRPLSGFLDLPFFITNLAEFPEALARCLGECYNAALIKCGIVESWFRLCSPKNLPVELDFGLHDKQGLPVTFRLEEVVRDGEEDELHVKTHKIPCIVKLRKNGVDFGTEDYMPQFFKTISRNAFLKSWKDLLLLAQDGEPWDMAACGNDEKKSLKSLENYLKITFNKLSLQDEAGVHRSLLPRDGGAALMFCTGLVTRANGDEGRPNFIYGYCSGMVNGRFTKIEWITRNDPRAEAMEDERFCDNHNLPWPALWTTNPAELVYQYHLGSPCNSTGKKGRAGFGFNHMISRHADRFPERYHTGQVNQYGQPVLSNPAELMKDICQAWKAAKKRLCMNYKWAVPTFYSGALDKCDEVEHQFSPVCLLVPLYLDGDESHEPDVALVLRRQLIDGDPNRPYYFAPTCLTMEMARNNARVITRLDDTWLNNDKHR